MVQRHSLSTLAGLVLAAAGILAATGCQTTVGGQTLPSPFFLEDDVQFFPAGPEFLLPNQVRALEQYRAEREAFHEQLTNGGGPTVPPQGAPASGAGQPPAPAGAAAP